jgi:hypothetical protein
MRPPYSNDRRGHHAEGCNKAAAARNANMEPFAAAGVDAPTIIHADINEIDETDDDDNGIISVADIPAQADHYPLNVPDTSDEDDGGEDNEDDDEDNNAPQENNPSNESGGESEGEEAPGVEDKTPGEEAPGVEDETP